MLQVHSVHRLAETEAVLRRVLQRHGAVVHAVFHLGHVFQERQRQSVEDAYVFAVCHPGLYSALLAADVRFAAFLPCHIAAWSRAGEVTLETVPPREFSRLLNRPDLDRLTLPLETMLREVIEEAARPAPAGAHASHLTAFGLGATEGQVSVRAVVPQRIDCRGTKVEDVAGTGEHDSAGG